MTDNWKAENACENVLSCLKKSNLHFVLKETPFSAQVIIRKKLIRFRYNENIHNIQTTPKIGENDRETAQLKKKIEMLESELKMVNNTFTQFNLKYRLQEKQMSEKQTQLERALQENSDLEKKLSKTQSEKKKYFK